MNDPELEAIRAKRLAELRAEHGLSNNAQNNARAEEEKKREDMRNSLLIQILDQSARARLNTLKVVKAEKAQRVEDMLLSMAQSGQLTDKLGDKDIVNLLQRINEKMDTKKTTVKFDRRRARLDDSDDDI